MRFRRSLLLLLVFLPLCLTAQVAPVVPTPQEYPVAKVVTPNAPCDERCSAMTDLLHKHFGPAFTLVRSFEPLMGDFDGDGQEDLLLVASAANPLKGQDEFGYKVVDPYDAYFGFGDPRVTQQFAMTNASGDPRDLLIISNWHGAAPAAKWVIINTPFEQLGVSKVTLKKKKMVAIAVRDATGTDGTIVWTGKKYKWSPVGADL